MTLIELRIRSGMIDQGSVLDLFEERVDGST